MPSLLEQALANVGVTPDTNGAIGAALGLTKALTDFQVGNAGLPSSGVGVGGQIRDLIEAQIPPIFRTNPNAGGLKFQGKNGEWEALHYADDLVARHPKFKFIFKVKFEGFSGLNDEFYYFVHRCDKPNVTFNHQDVNYYNFRTRVLTSTVFQPMSMTFLDEIGNTVTDFFVKYAMQTSGQGSGKWGIDKGFGDASSTKPYTKNNSHGKSIIINQIFANGLYSNMYKFINPRIESVQFDELNMEDNAGSLCTLQFSYDSIVMKTVNVPGGEGMYTWGNTDILKGGGTSGLPNAGATSHGETQQATSANGGAQIAGLGLQQFSNGVAQVVNAGINTLTQLPASLQGVLPNTIAAIANGVVSSAQSTINRAVSDTIDSISRGANFNTASIPGGDQVAQAQTAGVQLAGPTGSWVVGTL